MRLAVIPERHEHKISRIGSRFFTTQLDFSLYTSTRTSSEVRPRPCHCGLQRYIRSKRHRMLKIHAVKRRRRNSGMRMPRGGHRANDVHPLHQRSAVQVPKLVDVSDITICVVSAYAVFVCSILYTPFVQLLITIKFFDYKKYPVMRKTAVYQ